MSFICGIGGIYHTDTPFGTLMVKHLHVSKDLYLSSAHVPISDISFVEILLYKSWP